MNPNEEVPNLTGFVTDPDLFPNQLPEGVQKTADWYAHRRTYRDGRQVWEFFKRGSGGGPNGQGDAVAATIETEVPAIKERWEKESKAEQAAAAKPPEERNNNGRRERWNPQTREWDDVGEAVSATAPAASSSTAAPGGKPFIDDGPEAGATGRRWGWNPDTRLYDRDLGPSPSAQQPAKPENPTAPKEEVNPADPTRIRRWNPQAGEGRGAWEDAGPNQAEITRREAAVKAEAETNKPTPELAPDKKSWGYFDTSKTPPVWVTIPADQAPPLPGEPAKPPVQVEGVWGTWKTDAQGNATFEPVKQQPGQTPGAAGPALPTIIVGQSEAAIRSYADQLTAEVAAGRMTPARRDALLGQALQIAQVAVQDATIVQRETESRRNAAVNVATTLYTGSMNGFQNALSFVSKLNGDLPPGSDLGGKAFVALLGMQMILAERSGLYDVQRDIKNERGAESRGIASSASAATATSNAQIARLTDPTNPAAVDADRERIMADPVFKPQPPAEMPSPAAAEAAPATLPAPTGQPAAPAAAAQQTAVPAPLSPGLPGMMSPNSPTVDPSPAAPLPGATPPGEVPPPYNPPPGAAGHVPGEPVGSMIFTPEQIAAASGRTPGPSLDPAMFGHTPENPMLSPSQQPQQEYAVLQQPMQMQPPTPIDVPDLSSNPALLASQAASTPPWRMSPQQIEAYRAAGVPDEIIWQTPRFGVPA